MRALFLLLGLMCVGISAQAAPQNGGVKIDSLTPQNKGYLNDFCNFHPQSGLCYFTPNPVKKPPLTPPGKPAPVDPTPITLPGGPPPIICAKPTNCKTTVSGAAQLQAAMNSSQCGCEIVVSPGSYATINYTKSCPQTNPLMVRAASPNGVRITGALNLNGTGGIFQGFEITGGVNIAGDYNRVTRALFTASGQIDFKEGASYNRIDHNDFIQPGQVSGETGATIAFYRPRSVAQMYNSNRIDSNFFTTNGSSAPGYAIFQCMYGAQDGYQYLSQFGSSRTTIENNLFQNWNRTVMEVKCSDNKFINNTMINTGRILNRHGGRNLYQNNIFENMVRGLNVREFDNQIIGNYFNNAKIQLYKGARKYPDGSCWQPRAWMPAGYQAPQGPPAVRTILDKNRGGLDIGIQDGSGCEVPVLNTQIRCHEGTIRRLGDVGTTGPTSTSGCFTMPKRLTRNDAGRGAPETGCTAP